VTGRLALVMIVGVVLHAGAAEALVDKPSVTVTPGIGSYGREPVITVRGLNARSLEARLYGASMPSGTLQPWRRLVLHDGTWSGKLDPPALRGVYPIELRPRPEAAVLRSPRWLYRVYAPGTLARPTFATPEDAARWWVKTVPRAQFVAMRRWPRPYFDHRDRLLHQLFVVAYRPPQDHQTADELGMFVTAVRDGFDGRWRFLEATVSP
jgi:hypothetical protein